MKSLSKRPGIEPIRRYPYYKIQKWDESRMVWLDIQKKFFSIQELHQFVKAQQLDEQKVRVMIVEDDRNRKVDASIRLGI